MFLCKDALVTFYSGSANLLRHVTYNIPLAGLLTLVYWPFMTRLDWQKISTLVIVGAVPVNRNRDLLLS